MTVAVISGFGATAMAYAVCWLFNRLPRRALFLPVVPTPIFANRERRDDPRPPSDAQMRHDLLRLAYGLMLRLQDAALMVPQQERVAGWLTSYVMKSTSDNGLLKWAFRLFADLRSFHADMPVLDGVLDNELKQWLTSYEGGDT